MRRTHLLVALVGLVLALPLAASSSNKFPDRIDLPNGFQPEGIAIGKGTTFYVGSIPTGRVWQGDLRTGKGAVLVPNRGRQAVGVAFDGRNRRIFVAGGPTGGGFVYDARTGGDVAQFSFASAPTFVNDVVVTRNAAWFTDSFRKFLYKVPVGRHGQLGQAQAVPLTGDIEFGDNFNTNGIDATPDGRTLVIVQSNTGKLFTVNLRGVTNEIELTGGPLTAGDGILLHGRTLYVVRNTLNQIAVVKLSRKLSSGQVVRTITKPGQFDVPTTIDQFGKSLYAVNARFTTPPGPDVEYWVTRVRR